MKYTTKGKVHKIWFHCPKIQAHTNINQYFKFCDIKYYKIDMYQNYSRFYKNNDIIYTKVYHHENILLNNHKSVHFFYLPYQNILNSYSQCVHNLGIKLHKSNIQDYLILHSSLVYTHNYYLYLFLLNLSRLYSYLEIIYILCIYGHRLSNILRYSNIFFHHKKYIYQIYHTLCKKYYKVLYNLYYWKYKYHKQCYHKISITQNF